jgi:hypothetical protein
MIATTDKKFESAEYVGREHEKVDVHELQLSIRDVNRLSVE